MANENSKILTAEQEMQLRQPIEDYVGKIQEKIDSLRKDGTNKVLALQNSIDSIKRDCTLTKKERETEIAKNQEELVKAKKVEEKNKEEISGLISDAEAYLKAHFDKDYYQVVKKSCEYEKIAAKEKYHKKVEKLQKEHHEILSKLSDKQEIKDEKYVYKNKLFDAKMELEKELQQIKDRRHAAYTFKYH